MPRRPKSNRTSKVPTRSDDRGDRTPGSSAKKLSRTGQSSRTVKKSSGNRPRQGAPVPENTSGE